MQSTIVTGNWCPIGKASTLSQARSIEEIPPPNPPETPCPGRAARDGRAVRAASARVIGCCRGQYRVLWPLLFMAVCRERRGRVDFDAHCRRSGGGADRAFAAGPFRHAAAGEAGGVFHACRRIAG